MVFLSGRAAQVRRAGGRADHPLPGEVYCEAPGGRVSVARPAVGGSGFRPGFMRRYAEASINLL